jgi:hypothetical protein
MTQRENKVTLPAVLATAHDEKKSRITYIIPADRYPNVVHCS